jgi:hypothetical protein
MVQIQRQPRSGGGGTVKIGALIALGLCLVALIDGKGGSSSHQSKLLDYFNLTSEAHPAGLGVVPTKSSQVRQADLLLTQTEDPIVNEKESQKDATPPVEGQPTIAEISRNETTRRVHVRKEKTPPEDTVIDQNYKSPEWIYGPGGKLNVKPVFGKHRPEADAVFAFATGYSLIHLIAFVGSLLKTGYTGDIVFGVSPDLPEDLKEYIQYHAEHSNMVAYEVRLDCKLVSRRTRCTVLDMFQENGKYVPDSRSLREKAQLRFEFYWAWSLPYSSDSRIFLLDARDTYFQLNPFALLETSMSTTLHVFEEWEGRPIRRERSNSLWIKSARGEQWLKKIGGRNVVCSGTTVGGKPAIEMYTRAMVAQWDDTQCTIYGCDQGHHNFLVRGNYLEGAPNLTKVVVHPQGTGVANTVGIIPKYTGVSLRMHGYVDNTTDEILNKDGSPSPVVHQFDRDTEMSNIFTHLRANAFLLEWNNTLAEIKK